jgi:hypothetical protein
VKTWIGDVRFFNGRYWTKYPVRVMASTRRAAAGRAIEQAEYKLKPGVKIEGISLTLEAVKARK